MPARACARCGNPVGPDEYLCWDCRQELPIQPPAEPAAEAASRSGGQDAREAGPVRTFRGGVVPRGMVLPSRTQYHGTVLGMIAIGIVVVLTLAVFVSTGAGPYRVTNTLVGQSAAGAPAVTASVTNLGTNAGEARCLALWTDASGAQQPTRAVQTAIIQPGSSGTVTIALPAGAGARVRVSCT